MINKAAAVHKLDCSRLETLVVHRPFSRTPFCTAKVLIALAAKGGLPALRRLCIWQPSLQAQRGTDAVLTVLEAAGGLQSFSYTSVWKPVGAFEALAKANPGLVDVSIQFFGLEDAELPERRVRY